MTSEGHASYLQSLESRSDYSINHLHISLVLDPGVTGTFNLCLANRTINTPSRNLFAKLNSLAFLFYSCKEEGHAFQMVSEPETLEHRPF